MKICYRSILHSEKIYEKNFDILFKNLKLPDGRLIPPSGKNFYYCVSVLSDTHWVKRKKEDVAISEKGHKALSGMDNPENGFSYAWVCPLSHEYLKYLLFFLEKIRDKVNYLCLENLHYPDGNYCFCLRCKERNSIGERVKIIKNIFEKICSIFNNIKISLSLYPDPYNLKRRFGIDLNYFQKKVEFFVLPLYSLSYYVLYWIDTILYGFNSVLKKPVFVELYTLKSNPKNIFRALLLLCKYDIVNGIILFGNRKKLKNLKDYTLNSSHLLKRIENNSFQKLVKRIKQWEF